MVEKVKIKEFDGSKENQSAFKPASEFSVLDGIGCGCGCEDDKEKDQHSHNHSHDVHDHDHGHSHDIGIEMFQSHDHGSANNSVLDDLGCG